MKSPTSSDEGFTVLEMIVAFIILAVAMGLISQTIVLSRRAITIAEAEQRSVRELRYILAKLQVGSLSQSSSPHEASGGWTVERRQVNDGAASLAELKFTNAVGGRRRAFRTFMPLPVR